ncbi:MAG: hypothetical protein N3E36_03690 [Sulfolobales archaeon]|nr:hypothetical protein [Sulfolobales archaeon]MCX8199116.1 hypothetical protein [Sulfolobales archaeon]MDW8170095.1 hypothetical protein [Desulfurococcaceae archaeon]
MEGKPILADGSLVEDYSLLINYWRLAMKRDRAFMEKATIRAEDFRALERIVELYRGESIATLVDFLKQMMMERIDPGLAIDAYRETFGIEVSVDKAVNAVTEVLALWLLEAGRQLKIISYKSWRNSN